MSDNQEMDMQYPQEYQYGYEEENYDWDLTNKHSQDKPYNIYGLEEITKKIYEDNSLKRDITCLPSEWNLMLYYFCEFAEQQLFNVINQQQTGRKMIRYKEQYTPTVKQGVCMVCCDEKELIKNVCEHAFCYQCWNDFLLTNHKERTMYELFPMCPGDDCFFRTNLLLMENIWTRYAEGKKAFQKLLCLKFAQRSQKVKVCGGQGCNRAIFINYCQQRTLTCTCGHSICRICGQSDHYPLDCGDLKTWNKIVNDKDKQWLNEIVTQQCPMCKTHIDKNGGCIHMTCRCGHSFCWICLKVWSGHTNYGECSSIKKEDHEKKLKEQQDKIKNDEGSYNLRFEEAKSQVQRVQNITKRVNNLNFENLTPQLNKYHILTNDLLKIKETKEFIIKGLNLEKHCQIYVFLQRDGYQQLRSELKQFTSLISRLDDYLIDKITVVENTRNNIKKVNKTKDDPPFQIMISEVKHNFFSGWEQLIFQLTKARKSQQLLRSGKFMTLNK